MEKKWIVLLIIISLSFNIGTVSIVSYHMMMRKRLAEEMGSPGDMRSNFMQKKLGISKEQTQQIDSIFSETQKNILPFRKQIDEKKKEMFTMVKNGKIDEGKKEKLLAEISGLQMQIERKMLDSIIETRSKMTSEQREKFDKFFNNPQPRFSEERPPVPEGGKFGGPFGRESRGGTETPFHR